MLFVRIIHEVLDIVNSGAHGLASGMGTDCF